MKKLILLFLLLPVFSNTQANLDSLWGVWNDSSKADTSRLKAIKKISWNGYLFSQPDSAFYFAQMQYGFAKEKNEKKYMADALGTQGASFIIRADYSQAIGYYIKSLRIQEEIGFKSGIAASLNNIGIIYKEQGDYSQASDFYKKSLKIEEEMGNKKGLASSLNNIALIYEEQGDYSIALNYHTKSLQLREEIGDKQGIAYSLNNIGIIYDNQGDYSQAIDYYNKSLDLREEIGDKQGIATTLNNIGTNYYEQGEKAKAIDYFIKSLRILEEIGDSRGKAHSLNNIGLIYHEQGNNYTQVIDYFIKSLKILEEIGEKRMISSSLNNIGNVYFDQGDYNKANEYSEQSLAIARETRAPKQIKDASRSLFKTSILTNQTTIALNQLSAIRLLLEDELETNFFTLSEKEKQLYFVTMENDYGLFHDFALNYQNKFENLTDTSYNIALQNKGLTLKSSTVMRQSIQNSGDTTLIKDYEEWLSLKKKLANISSTDSTYKVLQNEANEMERGLVKNSAVFSDFDKVKNLKWQDVQAGLKENEAAIEFVHFTSEIDTANPVIYAALIVKKESKNPAMVKLCNETDLKEIIGNFQGNNLNYVNAVYGTQQEEQTALYEKVWKPLEENLVGVENIYLSPSGLLHKIAFHAIAKEKNTYLCDAYNLRQQNSTGKVALPEEVTFEKKQNFLMLGGIQYNTDTSANEVWSYLPGTLEETNNIKSYLQKRKYKVTHLTADEAGEKAFKTKAPEANILHIATHGFFFPDPEKVRAELKKNQEYYEDIAFRGQDVNPDKIQRGTRYADWTFVKNKNSLMRSGLVLANANDVWQRSVLAEGEDGVLTANEVSTLNLNNIDLVVLSACETGLGDIKGSEGVYGLQRAFKIAGANHLIMSLWQVPDKETSAFMQLFYKNLLKMKDVPKAFNAAQKSMRKKYDPYYWAAFVLVE